MSVKFDLTVIAPELMDAVVCMDGSPALAAFSDEIKAILADFKKNSHFGTAVTFDENNLVDGMEETLVNMQQAFLLWTYIEDEKKPDAEKKYNSYLKLFFKSNCDKIAAQNGGSTTVGAEEAAALKEKFISDIKTDSALFDSLKEFFKGYVYGYFFNYLEEQTVMAKYAEFLVCLGMMTGKITASSAAQQKIMPKMASLLGSDRLKYISGFIPLDTMLEIVYGRFAFPKLAEDRMTRIKTVISDYITAHYDMDSGDEGKLVSAKVTADVMTAMNSGYINSGEYAASTYQKAFSGVRTFLDKDADDTGEFSADNIHSIIAKRCADDHLEYFTTEREPNLDVSLSSGTVGYKYPLVFKDASDYWYSPIYQHIVNDLLQEQIYAEVSADSLPIEDFPFADAALKTNVLRELVGDPSEGYAIRADKKNVLNKLIDIHSSRSTPDDSKKMLMLEQVLYLISGNCSADKYSAVIDKEIFSSPLFDEYISYRINKQCVSVDSKKKFISGLNN